MAVAAEKLLPQNVEAEAGVLGSLLIDPDATVQVADFLKADDFYREAHRAIFQAMMDLYENRAPADLITLTDELARRGKLEEIGGLSYVSSLANGVPTSANVEHYARIVERTAILRRLIHAAGQIAAVAYNEPDATVALDQAEKLVFAVSQRSLRADLEPIRDTLREYMDKLDQLHERRGDIVGVATGFGDLDKLTGGLQKSDLIILAARPSVGKCLTAHTLIDDPLTGARLTIEECVRQRQPQALNLSENGRIQTTAITDWIDSGIQPAFRVRTNSGRMVEVTGHHPFLTVRGWVPLHDLKVGDTIAVPWAAPVFGSDESWPLELVRLLAYFIAEGGLTDRSPEFTNTDPVIIEDFKAIITRYFPACAIRQDKITYIVAQPRTSEAMKGRGGIMPPNPVVTWLKECGMWDKLARDKFFPAYVWTWSKQYLAEFIKVIMSCDGSIYASGSAGYPRIEFGVASHQLAADMQHALIRFGVTAKFYQTTQGAWRVGVTAPEAVRRFQEEIGWIGEKVTRFAGLARNLPKRMSNIGHPPQEIWKLVRTAAQAQGFSMVELARRSGETEKVGKFAGYNPHMRRSLPRYRLARYAEALDDAQLHKLASPDIYWDPIVSIEPLGDQQVYDLTVPDGENFVAQDVFVHNTALALSLAHNATLRFGHTIGIFSLEMSKEQLVARLLSMDAMVDQQRLRTGRLQDDEWDRISESVGRLSEAKIYLDDTPGISLTEMRSKARRLMMERGFDLLIVDYLQLMQGSGGGRVGHENRVQEISEISRGLKGLARELDIPVLALSQLSRAVESRTDKRPQLSDLRESGCLTGDTPIYLPDEGKYRPIRDLVGQSGFRALALNTETWKLEPHIVTNAFSTGRKPVHRLTTRLGRTIRATANHKFLTIGGWRRLDELGQGMRLALPRRLPGPEQATMTDDELALLGHLIGDGCTLPNHCVQYTTADAGLAELVADLGTRVFGDSVKPRIHQDVVGERRWYQVFLPMVAHATHGVRNPIVEWVNALGVFGLRSHEKYVPEKVFAQPIVGIARFLRHLWATDGCIHLSVSVNHYANVYYASSSVQLAQDVQSLLLRLGINAALSRHPQQGKGRDQYHITVSGKSEIESFLTLIGGLGEAKAEHHALVSAYLSEKVANTNRDIIPREAWQLHALPARRSLGLTDRQMQALLGNAYCGTGLYKQNMSRERAARLAAVVQSAELAQLAESDIYWDKVVSIEPDGEEEVYDLTVEGLHNFAAANITSHNSIEQDADVVAFIYRDEVYNPETERPNIADIIIAKHRNGPTGTINLYFQPAQTRFRDLDLRPVDY
jgi:replicative DNA helicase